VTSGASIEQAFWFHKRLSRKTLRLFQKTCDGGKLMRKLPFSGGVGAWKRAR